METAIKKAIQGGYELRKENSFFADIKDLSKISVRNHIILLDPLFWQALGKAEGWDLDVNNPTWLCPVCANSLDEMICQIDEKSIGIETWRYNWHLFLDHIAEGKSIAEFFNSLLSPDNNK